MLQKKGSVLVVIDMQEKLVPLLVKKEEVIGNIVKLIKFCKACKVPILLTEQYPKGLGRTIEEIRAELRGLAPIEKTSFSCFGSEEFKRALKKINAKTLIITGIEAHICVMQTALESPKDFRVYVVADAISSRKVEEVNIALQRMRDAGITVSSTEMLMYELIRDSKTKDFKKVRQLLRTINRN